MISTDGNDGTVHTRCPLRTIQIAVVMSLLCLFGCAHVTNGNQALCPSAPCSYDQTAGYRFNPEKHPDRHTLVVVTFSGGGIRASSLAYGALLALRDLPGIEPNHSLLDDVDIVSSVSGGSVTAAWYALHGSDALNDNAKDSAVRVEFENFLEHGEKSDSLAWRGLNPISIGRYVFTPYQRSDALRDIFSARLFNAATYKDIETKYNGSDTQPFVILNATDFGHEISFPFTQNRFDLICSNLSQYMVADAVTASADFPLVFSPVGLKNYATSCQGAAHWPPEWIFHYESQSTSASDSEELLSNQLFHIRAARDALEYANPDSQDTVLHLLDGGIVDNLGIQSTIALDDNFCAPISTTGPCASDAPGLYQRLHYRGVALQDTHPHAPRYLKIDSVLYVVVNARSRRPTDVDATIYPPQLVTTLAGLVDTPIDNTILYTQNYLTAELEATAAKDISRGDAKDTATAYNLHTHIVTIDFEMIPNKKCRSEYWQLGTSWSLPGPVIQNLIRLPRTMVFHSPDLRQFYEDMGKQGALNKALSQRGFDSSFASLCPPDHELSSMAALLQHQQN